MLWLFFLNIFTNVLCGDDCVNLGNPNKLYIKWLGFMICKLQRYLKKNNTKKCSTFKVKNHHSKMSWGDSNVLSS